MYVVFMNKKTFVVIERAKTASESDPFARIEPQKIDENGRDYDDDASTSPKSNEAFLSTYGTHVSFHINFSLRISSLSIFNNGG